MPKLDDNYVRRFAMGKVFNDNTERINSLDFHSSGEHLVSAGDDQSINIYNMKSGTNQKTLYSRKYGVDLIRYTHSTDCVISASKVENDHTIRYLKLHNNQYLRYFKGHTDSVVSMCMSPLDDSFISGSADTTCRLWDLRTNICQGLLNLGACSQPQVAIDPDGLVFAVGFGRLVKVFDKRGLDNGPFATFRVPLPAGLSPDLQWTGLKFSRDGEHLLLPSTENATFLLNAYEGNIVKVFRHHSYSVRTHEASFSPDGQYVLAGSENKSIHVWKVESGQEVAEWRGHESGVSVVQWCPTMNVVVSGGHNLVFWLPAEEEQA